MLWNATPAASLTPTPGLSCVNQHRFKYTYKWGEQNSFCGVRVFVWKGKDEKQKRGHLSSDLRNNNFASVSAETAKMFFAASRLLILSIAGGSERRDWDAGLRGTHGPLP